MGYVVKLVDEIRSEWTAKQDELREAGLSKKEAQKLNIDQRKLTILARLKEAGGPFMHADEVDGYMERNETETERAQKRMRDEITYARDTSKSLPHQYQLFKILNPDHTTKKLTLFSNR